MNARSLLVCGAAGKDRTRRIQTTLRGGMKYHCYGPAHESPGGVATRFAWTLGRRGHNPVFVSAVGDDPAGKQIFSWLNNAEADLRSFRVVPSEETSEFDIYVSPDGERTPIMCFSNGLADQYFDDETLNSITANVDTAFFDGAGNERLQGTLIERLSATDAAIFLNIELRDSVTATLAAKGTHLIVAEQALGDDLEDTVIRAFTMLKPSTRCQLLVVTQGAKGSIALVRQKRAWLMIVTPAWLVPSVIDTTGAGDMFAAHLVHGIRSGVEVATSLAMASAAASFAVEVIGYPSLPTIEQMETRMAAISPRQTVTPIAPRDFRPLEP